MQIFNQIMFSSHPACILFKCTEVSAGLQPMWTSQRPQTHKGGHLHFVWTDAPIIYNKEKKLIYILKSQSVRWWCENNVSMLLCSFLRLYAALSEFMVFKQLSASSRSYRPREVLLVDREKNLTDQLQTTN